MPEIKPDKVWLFRIIHINNLEYILRHGIFTSQHPMADPDYINIGDSKLIEQRSEYSVRINPPGGVLGKYVPFYFGPLSPMLFNIKTGYRGITQRPQKEIVYICCKLTSIITHCTEWCFTNGHAKDAITDFYNNIEYLNEVDWEIVKERYWRNTEEDFDRMRRKQAEFLVKGHVPAQCIGLIIVYNKESSKIVQKIIDHLKLNIRVYINPKNQFYY